MYCILNKRYDIFSNLSARAGYDTRSIFKWSLTGLNSEFSFSTSCLTKAEEPSLHYYLPIAGGRIIGFIPFPRVLVLCEIQSVSSRIWTHVAVSISYDDNHYTSDTWIKDITIFLSASLYHTLWTSPCCNCNGLKVWVFHRKRPKCIIISLKNISLSKSSGFRTCYLQPRQ